MDTFAFSCSLLIFKSVYHVEAIYIEFLFWDEMLLLHVTVLYISLILGSLSNNNL